MAFRQYPHTQLLSQSLIWQVGGAAGGAAGGGIGLRE
jgi:hypothetical protein